MKVRHRRSYQNGILASPLLCAAFAVSPGISCATSSLRLATHIHCVYYTDKTHRQGAQKNTQDSALVKRANASRVPRVCQFSKLSTNEFRWIRLDSKHSNASIKREIRFTIFQSIERESALRRLGFVSPVTYKFSLGTKNVARLWS